MEIKPLRLDDTYEIILEPKHDARGYFMRLYDEFIFAKHGMVSRWVQENQSLSVRRGIIRGLHFQVPPHAETKLVRAVAGAVFDVFIDLRKDSSTYGQWDSVTLSEDAFNTVYIPKGFAHGFCTLTENATVAYKVDAAFAPEHEGGLRWNDADLGIVWPTDDPYLSERDQALPLFREFVSPF